MTRPLSSRTQNIAASLTVTIDTLAKQMIAEGKDVVSLGAGEPDFPTPEPIREAACKAINEGKTRYTAPVGILDLRKAVCEKLERENGLHYTPEQIIMTSGAKHAVFNALAAIINPGDEVIVPAPYWVTYPELVKWLGGTIVQGSREQDFKITAEQLKNACTDKTKAILINNPCNPTGAVYSREELEALTKVIVEKDLYCISDEVYEYFVYDREFVSTASFDGMAERTIIVNGFSKSYCMTGWRIGYSGRYRQDYREDPGAGGSPPEQRGPIRRHWRLEDGPRKRRPHEGSLPQAPRLHDRTDLCGSHDTGEKSGWSLLPVRPGKRFLREIYSRRKGYRGFHWTLPVPARKRRPRHRSRSGFWRRHLRPLLVCRG